MIQKSEAFTLRKRWHTRRYLIMTALKTDTYPSTGDEMEL